MSSTKCIDAKKINPVLTDAFYRHGCTLSPFNDPSPFLLTLTRVLPEGHCGDESLTTSNERYSLGQGQLLSINTAHMQTIPSL